MTRIATNIHVRAQPAEATPARGEWRPDPSATECCAQAQMDSAARAGAKHADLSKIGKSGGFVIWRAWLQRWR